MSRARVGYESKLNAALKTAHARQIKTQTCLVNGFKISVALN